MKCKKWDRCTEFEKHEYCNQPECSRVEGCPYYKSILRQKREEEKNEK